MKAVVVTFFVALSATSAFGQSDAQDYLDLACDHVTALDEYRYLTHTDYVPERLYYPPVQVNVVQDCNVIATSPDANTAH